MDHHSETTDAVSGEDQAPRVRVLMISGPVGVGKTSVAHEMFDQLSDRDIPHAIIDIDALGISWPFADGDPYNNQMAMRNLAAIWSNFAAAGATHAVLPRVIESEADLAPYRDAIPGADIQICRLVATDETLRERITTRETGSSQEALLRRAVQLAESLEASPTDFTIHTDGRALPAIAQEALAKAGWL
jgi:gluconate kinase